VDNALKYVDGPVADLLRSVKRNFGTEGATNGLDQRLAFLSRTAHAAENQSSAAKQDSDSAEPDLWHAIVKGIDDTLQRYGLGWGGLSHPSRKLANNMIRDGSPRPPGHDAHHIVPAEDRRFPGAEEARKILEKFKIDLYDSANGVWLPRKPGIAEATYHPGVHTKTYYRAVERLLHEAGNRDHAKEILKSIGRGLSNGTFPK